MTVVDPGVPILTRGSLSYRDYGDGGSPYYRDYGDGGPHFTGIMGTEVPILGGPHFTVTPDASAHPKGSAYMYPYASAHRLKYLKVIAVTNFSVLERTVFGGY